jgi:hypothetical protein
MRAGTPTLVAAIVCAAVATLFVLRPFEQALHGWQFAVGAALVGAALLVQGVAGLRPRGDEERFAALGALGGALLCAAMVTASFAVGPPHEIAGAPGQTTSVMPGATVFVDYPAAADAMFAPGAALVAVAVVTGSKRNELNDGEQMKVGQYVLRAEAGPMAQVRATSPSGRRVTVTQPQGAAFASPYLLFPARNGAQRLDFFAVPPLHRTVNVVYYDSYRDDSRHISIPSPFVIVQVAEENGGELFRSATVSGKTIRGGGVNLTFLIGRYPIVTLGSAPATLPYIAGLMMLVAGLAGYMYSVLRAPQPARP